MGQPSLSIYVHELINVYGLKTLIRIGTCGGLHASVKVRDLILAQAASTDSTIVKDGFGAFNFAPIADFGLLRSAADKAEQRGMRAHVGNMLSSDIFYHIEPGMEAMAGCRRMASSASRWNQRRSTRWPPASASRR